MFHKMAILALQVLASTVTATAITTPPAASTVVKRASLSTPSILPAQTFPAIDFEYYPDQRCSRTPKGIILFQSNLCYNLPAPGGSFHIGLDGKGNQIPDGCKINGFSKQYCKGYDSLNIYYPDGGDLCFVATPDEESSVLSVILTCPGDCALPDGEPCSSTILTSSTTKTGRKSKTSKMASSTAMFSA